MYSVKKLRFDTVVDIDSDLFESTIVPTIILAASQQIMSGATVIASSGGTSTTITAETLNYLTNLTDQYATVSNSTTVTIPAAAANNPSLTSTASKNEFDVYINGQYIDKSVYTWTPSDASPQTIVFDTGILGYSLDSSFIIVVNGRWS
jgi:hypothetical protein